MKSEKAFSESLLNLGRIHCLLLNANHLLRVAGNETDLRRTIKFPLESMSVSEIGNDIISWWVFEQEHDIPALRKKTERALDFAKILKEASVNFAKAEYVTLEELQLEYADFTNKNKQAIQEILKYVEWLHGKHKYAPAILYNDLAWSITRIKYRNVLTDPARLDDLNTIKECSDVVLGLIIQSISVRDWIVSDVEHRLSEEKIQTIAVRVALSQFTEYFAEFRDCLKKVLSEIGKREKNERLVTSDDFWRQFIVVSSNSTKTEQKYWDFKQTLDMWQKKDKREKLDKEKKFAEIVAGFANNKGGVIVIGVSDASPRQIVGLGDDTHPLENNMKYTSQVLGKYIAYDGDYFHLQQVNVPDHNGDKQLCLVIAVKQTRETLGVAGNDGNVSYPFRQETGLERKEKEVIQKLKREIKNDNYDFLTVLQRFVIEEI